MENFEKYFLPPYLVKPHDVIKWQNVQNLCINTFSILYTTSNEKFSLAGGGGGTCQNFDRDACPIFLGLKFGQILFFWVGKFLAIFLGFAKFPLFFWV